MDTTTNSAQPRLILDVDTGEDDALAILLAVKLQLPLSHIITSFGNTSLDNSTRNSAALLQLAKVDAIPVIRGSSKPLQPHPYDKTTALAGDFVGANGLCNVELPASTTVPILEFEAEQWEEKMMNILIENKKTDWIITGPATNLARLIAKYGSELHRYIGTVYLMGGAVDEPGNSGPTDPITNYQVAEFNFYCDPHATNIVLKSGLPLAIVPWDVTMHLTIPYRDIERMQSSTPAGAFVVELMKKFFENYGLAKDRNFELNDPITVLAYQGYGSFTEKTIRVLEDPAVYGKTISDTSGTKVKWYTMPDHSRTIDKTLSILEITLA